MSPYKFFAFISYRHTDAKAAKRLQSLLEQYNLPTKIREHLERRYGQRPEERQSADLPPKRFKVFRDTDELTGGILTEELQKKLDESKFLVVICSPASAESKYVGDEIAYFRSKGRERQIIPFIIDGAPHSDRECFHPQLTLGGLELLGIDVQAEEGLPRWLCFPGRSYLDRRLRFHKAFVRTVAYMLGLDFGVLWCRRRRRLVRQAVSAALLTIAVAGAIAHYARKAYRERPFDLTVTLREAAPQTPLPLSTDGRDTLYLHLDAKDVRRLPIKSLRERLSVPNIPGRYRDRRVRVVCMAFGCNPLDTMVELSGNLTFDIRRNLETFGRIRHYVTEPDGETPVAGAVFDFGSVKATTDERGLLDVSIPLQHQRPGRYPVKITHRGKERRVAFQRELDPLLDRTDTCTICLEH